MTVVPLSSAVTAPVVGLIVATATAWEFQVPPNVASDNVDGVPWQTTAVPDIGAGKAFMVIDNTLKQPSANV